MDKSVGRADLFRHVDRNALRIALGDKWLEWRKAAHQIVPALVELVAGHADRRAFNTVAAAVGEHPVGHAAHVASTQFIVHGIELVFLLHHDPHVDAVVPHRRRQDQVELVAANLAQTFPARAGVLGGRLRAKARECEERRCERK